MKKLIGLVCFLLVLLLASYGYLGYSAERDFKYQIDQVNLNKPGYAVIDYYHRGWFTSEALVTWNVATDQVGAKDKKYIPQKTLVSIYHGPIIYVDNRLRFGRSNYVSKITIPTEYQEQFGKDFSAESTKPEIIVNVFENYFSTKTLKFDILPFKLNALKENFQLDWLGMNNTFTYSSNYKKLHGKIGFNGAGITNKEKQFSLGKISSTYNFYKSSPGLFLGKGNVTLNTITYTESNVKKFGLQEFTFTTDSSISSHLYEANAGYSIKSVTFNNETYGPGVLNVGIKNLDADVFGKVTEQIIESQGKSEAEKNALVFSLMTQAPAIFYKGAEFNSTLNMQFPQGLVEWKIVLNLPKEENINPVELFQKATGHATFSCPVALVKKYTLQSVMIKLGSQPAMHDQLVMEYKAAHPETAQVEPTQEQLATLFMDKQLATLEQQGIIVVKDSLYTLDLVIDKGQVLVNDKPFDMTKLPI